MIKFIKKNWKDIAIILTAWVIALGAFTIATADEVKHKYKGETEISTSWCNQRGGIAEYKLAIDKSRVDCLLEDYAVEHDWGYGTKPYECIGQALSYAYRTNRKPMCVLIRKDKKDWNNAYLRLMTGSYNIVKIECIDEDLHILNCQTGELK